MIPYANTQSLLEKFKGKKILVVGDLVLDHYLEGTVSRISPEAPVPIVTLGDHSERKIPGGAANVALNVLSLGGKPFLAGIVGQDEAGKTLLNLLDNAGVNVDSVVSDGDRPTTVKTRVMGRNQQLIRIDKEKTHELAGPVDSVLRGAIDSILNEIDAVILEDYDKGVLSESLIAHIIESCVTQKIPVAVDPKIRNFWSFSNCSLFKPNRHEAGMALGITINDVDTAIDAARQIMNRLSAEAVLITLGSKGSVLVNKGNDSTQHLHTVARLVFDVSGAGDSVIAVMGLTQSCGISTINGAILANLAAAAVCAKPGVYAVKPEDILHQVSHFE